MTLDITRMKPGAWLAALALGIGLVITLPRAIDAAELIVIDSPVCEWCDMWEDDVGVVYDRTAQGKRAPARRIGMSVVDDMGINFARPVVYTPTFVLMDGGREVGRINGYPGESHFWSLLDELLEKLPHAETRGCIDPKVVAADNGGAKKGELC